MSCCPGIKCKNTGSGYVKADCGTEGARELEKRMADMLAARDAQDAKIWGAPPATPPQPRQEVPKNTVVYLKR